MPLNSPETERNTIYICNKEIADFYRDTRLDPESMNLLFIQIIKKINLSSSASSFSLKQHAASEDTFRHIFEQFAQLNEKIALLQEHKKENSQQFKQILALHTNETIQPLLKDIQSHLLDKTTLLLSEIVPKGNAKLEKDMQMQFQLFQSTLANETTKLLSSSLDKKNLDEFFGTLMQNFGTSHNTLITLLSSSENRIENRLVETERKISEIKELTNSQQSVQSSLFTNVSEILKKFEKGSSRGNASEHIVYNILLSMFPCAQIDHVGNEQKETGDIILIRNNKPKILIENKDHTSSNVPKADVEKFIRDCEIQNCCGIMLAQHRGIANKQNFELQLHNGNVLLYCHEVNFDQDKIKIAIEIVEQFKVKIDATFQLEDGTNGPTIIENDTLIEINREFQQYVLQKSNLCKILKDFNEKMSGAILDVKFPMLEKFLTTKFASSATSSTNMIVDARKCIYCEKIVPKNMNTHHRFCKKRTRQQMDDTV